LNVWQKLSSENFLFIKATLFGWESFVIFLATQGQRLPGAAGV